MHTHPLHARLTAQRPRCWTLWHSIAGAGQITPQEAIYGVCHLQSIIRWQDALLEQPGQLGMAGQCALRRLAAPYLRTGPDLQVGAALICRTSPRGGLVLNTIQSFAGGDTAHHCGQLWRNVCADLIQRAPAAGIRAAGTPPDRNRAARAPPRSRQHWARTTLHILMELATRSAPTPYHTPRPCSQGLPVCACSRAVSNRSTTPSVAADRCR